MPVTERLIYWLSNCYLIRVVEYSMSTSYILTVSCRFSVSLKTSRCTINSFPPAWMYSRIQAGYWSNWLYTLINWCTPDVTRNHSKKRNQGPPISIVQTHNENRYSILLNLSWCINFVKALPRFVVVVVVVVVVVFPLSSSLPPPTPRASDLVQTSVSFRGPQAYTVL